MRATRWQLILSTIFSIAFVVPIIYLVFGSWFFEIGGSSLTVDTFLSILTSARTGSLLVNTLAMAGGSAAITTILATVYALIVVRTDVPGRRFLHLIAILPLTMPFLVRSFAWIYLFSPRSGLANVILNQLFGTGTVFNIYSYWGLIFALGTGGVPLVYLSIEPALRSMNPSLEEASRVSGRGFLKTIFKVTLPLLLPAILSGTMLTFIFALENFDYPFTLGGPAGYKTLATEVFYWISNAQPPRYGTSAILSIVFVVLTMSFFAVYIWVTRKAFKFTVVTGKASRETVHKLRKWKYVAFAVCFLIFFFTYILPFGTIVLMSATTFLSTVGGHISVQFTLQNYANAVNLPMFFDTLGNTVIIGVATGAIATLIAVFMSYASLKSKAKGGRLIDFFSSLPLAFPGIVYGLALFWTFLLLPGISNLIYGTIWPLIIALVFIRLPYCIRMISGNLIQISDELEESSRVCGASWTRTFRRIMLPLLRGGLTNSFLYTFINSLRELGAVILLVTPQSMLFTVLLLNLYQQHALALNTIAAASVILSFLITAALIAQSLLPSVLSRRRTKACI